MKSASASLRRRGFTLIELLLVMSIIGILMALSLAAIMKVRGLGDKTVASTEIRELAQALNVCQTTYTNLRYIPSKLILRRDMTTYASNTPITFGAGGVQVTYQPTAQENQRSAETLQAMFGRQIFNVQFNASNTRGLLWSNNSNEPSTTTGWVLFGPECLVFFTGGIMTDPATSGGVISPLGFSTANADPTTGSANPGTMGARKGPFFPNFKSQRFVAATYLDPITKKTVATGFYQYQDPFEVGPGQPGQPYAFFSSYGGGSTANNYTTTANTVAGASLGDCYTLPKTSLPAPTNISTLPAVQALNPYIAPNGVFLNKDTYQIISAGPDRLFGPGNVWDARSPATSTKWDPRSADNLTNFASGSLLAPQ